MFGVKFWIWDYVKSPPPLQVIHIPLPSSYIYSLPTRASGGRSVWRKEGQTALLAYSKLGGGVNFSIHLWKLSIFYWFFRTKVKPQNKTHTQKHYKKSKTRTLFLWGRTASLSWGLRRGEHYDGWADLYMMQIMGKKKIKVDYIDMYTIYIVWYILYKQMQNC